MRSDGKGDVRKSWGSEVPLWQRVGSAGMDSPRSSSLQVDPSSRWDPWTIPMDQNCVML